MNVFKGVWHFKKWAHLLSYQGLKEKIVTTLCMSVWSVWSDLQQLLSLASHKDSKGCKISRPNDVMLADWRKPYSEVFMHYYWAVSSNLVVTSDDVLKWSTFVEWNMCSSSLESEQTVYSLKFAESIGFVLIGFLIWRNSQLHHGNNLVVLTPWIRINCIISYDFPFNIVIYKYWYEIIFWNLAVTGSL